MPDEKHSVSLGEELDLLEVQKKQELIAALNLKHQEISNTDEKRFFNKRALFNLSEQKIYNEGEINTEYFMPGTAKEEKIFEVTTHAFTELAGIKFPWGIFYSKGEWYIKSHVLGGGATGTVCMLQKIIVKNDTIQLAETDLVIKEISTKSLDQDIREAAMLNPSIPRFRVNLFNTDATHSNRAHPIDKHNKEAPVQQGCYGDDTNTTLFYFAKYLGPKNLQEYIKDNTKQQSDKKPQYFSLFEITQILMECAYKLNRIYGKIKSVHQDLKPENILIEILEHDGKGNFEIKIKIADWEFSTSLSKEPEKRLLMAGTEGYLDPVLQKKNIPAKEGIKCDIYSFGIIMKEMLKLSSKDNNAEEKKALENLNKLSKQMTAKFSKRKENWSRVESDLFNEYKRMLDNHTDNLIQVLGQHTHDGVLKKELQEFKNNLATKKAENYREIKNEFFTLQGEFNQLQLQANETSQEVTPPPKKKIKTLWPKKPLQPHYTHAHFFGGKFTQRDSAQTSGPPEQKPGLNSPAKK